MSLISPGLALAVILATTFGAVFHLWRGGGYGMLVRYLLAAWGGFALGQLVGWLGGWEFALVGQVSHARRHIGQRRAADDCPLAGVTLGAEPVTF